MTDARPRPARRTGRSDWVLAAAVSLAIFFGLFAFLANRVRIGHDPVIGAKLVSAPAKPPVITQRVVVVKKVIVTMLPPKPVPSAVTAGAVGGGVQVAAPVQAAQPVYTRPAQPVYVAPAPRAAPVVTRSS